MKETPRFLTVEMTPVQKPLPALANLKLILLDRDGVINLDSPGYIKSPAEWRPIPGAIKAIITLQAKFSVAVCTNQSGLARGLFDEFMLGSIHDELNAHIESAGGEPINIFYCPHHPDAGCHCRKPKPGLLHLAMRTHHAYPGITLFAGDSRKDVMAAEKAGCISALVLTGNGDKTAKSQAGQRADITCDDLAALAATLL